MTTGLDEFKSVLAEYRSVALWAGLSTSSVPFIAAFAGVTPPWPDGIAYMTAVVQLIGIILTLKLYSDADKRSIGRNLSILTVVILVLLLSYIFVFSQFTIFDPARNGRIVIGYECTAKVLQAYPELTCPSVGFEELRNAAFKEAELWTMLSISVVRTAIVAIWFLLFLSLAALVGQFLAFQRKRVVRRKAAG